MIKDQCDKCKKRMSDQCKGVTEFDGSSCENYSKGIDLAKHDESETLNNSQSANNRPIGARPGTAYFDYENSQPENEEEFEITREYLRENTTMHGWLVFFLFAVCVGALISAIYPLVTFNISEYDGIYALAFTDVFFGLALLFIAGYTVYSFKTRQPNAVFVTKIYVVLILLSNLLSIINGEFDNEGFNTLKSAIRGVTWGIVWFIYLCTSSQVNEIIPKVYRKRKSFDYYLLAGIVIIPLLLFSIGIAQVYHQNNTRKASMIEATELQYGEYTDGIAVIKCPYDFTCDEKDAQYAHNQSIKIFSLESPYAQMTVCSDFDSDMSDRNFKSYWANWKDDDLKSFNEHIEIDRIDTINGHPYHYRMARYENGETELSWRYIMIFDPGQEKVTLVSAYDGYPEYEHGPDDYILDFISNIRFE